MFGSKSALPGLESRSCRLRNRQPWLRRLLLAGTAAAALCFSAPAWAIGPVYCINCNTLAQGLLSYGKQLVQLQQEIATAQNTLNFYLELIQDTISLPFSVYNDAQGTINQMQSLGNTASLTSGTPALMLGNLSNAAGYPLAAVSNMNQQFINEDVALAAAINAAGGVINRQPSLFSTQSAAITAAVAQSNGASGETQAIQAGNEIAAADAQQTATTQAALTYAAQAQLTNTTVNAERQAIYEAAQQQFSTFSPLPTTGYQGF
jgi:P-type conjugative transfer protein TrbJ